LAHQPSLARSARLEQALSNGTADIAAITGAAPILLRPPFWNYDKRTFAAYQQHGCMCC
jgi:peptidoglycan/xylan/chitin deacetylase (PgdA/CDA1 family)